jgi:uncharacterized protein
MRKRMTWLWIAAVAAMLLAGVLGWVFTHPAQGSEGILYHVTGGQGEMFLLGSIHIGTKEMYPFGQSITDVMAGADTFVYECDTTSDTAVAEVRSCMLLPDGQTLKGLIGNTLYAELETVAAKLSLSLSTLDGQKPWAVINNLAVYSTAAELGETDISAALSLGVEKKVQAYAQGHGKQTAYLETAGEQIDVLEGFSDVLKNYLLKSECDTILNPQSATGMDASIVQWPTWWRTGDASAFSSQYLSTYITPGYETQCQEYHDKLIIQRNARMAEKLGQMLRGGGSYFVTVGLLHLTLPEGSIVELLREQGYTVEQIVTP